MNQQDKFSETVAILVKAYLHNTLMSGTCTACAVGNLVAAHSGYKITPLPHLKNTYWDTSNGPLCPGWYDLLLRFRGSDPNNESMQVKHQAEQEVEKTGYSLAQIGLIEEAFEMDGYKQGTEYERLMRVVDCLAQIHSIDLATATASKALFVK